MLQKDYLFDWRNIYQNVLLGLEIRGALDRKSRKRALDLLETYGLYDFKDKYPNQLSGGMRQRAALIRTLAVDPEGLPVGEARTALVYQTRIAVIEDISAVVKTQQKTVIMVTHDIAESISMSDRIIVLSKRPATVVAVHDINFSLKERTPLACRETQEFPRYFNMIWRELDVHV